MKLSNSPKNINMKTYISRSAITFIVASFLLAITAYPKFPEVNIPGVAGGSGSESPKPTISASDFGKQLEVATSNVLGARIQFLRAQADMASALGLKNDSLVKAAEALSAVSGTANSGEKVNAIKDSQKQTADAQKAVKDGMANSESLSDEAKGKFLEGTVKFIDAIILERAQIVTIKQLIEQGKDLSKSSGLMEKPKILGLVKPATELASMVPGDVKEGLTVFAQISSFAAKHKLALPSNASQMSKLGDDI